MNSEQKLLNFIYQNAQMGVVTLPELIESVEDNNIRRIIADQFAEYRQICDEAEELMEELGGSIKEVSPVAQHSARAMADMKSKWNRSASYAAETVIKGSNRGVIEIERHLNACPKADPRVVELAKRLERTEQSNLDRMKGFLC